MQSKTRRIRKSSYGDCNHAPAATAFHGLSNVVGFLTRKRLTVIMFGQ